MATKKANVRDFFMGTVNKASKYEKKELVLGDVSMVIMKRKITWEDYEELEKWKAKQKDGVVNVIDHVFKFVEMGVVTAEDGSALFEMTDKDTFKKSAITKEQGELFALIAGTAEEVDDNAKNEG